MFVEFKAPQDIQYSMSLGQKQFKINTHSFSKCCRTITFTYYRWFRGAGVGKSNLVKILTSFSKKTFTLYSGTPDKKKKLLLAPTGAAAMNIDGTTILSGLGINPHCNTYSMDKLCDKH